MVASFVRALVSAFKTHRDLALENLTLQQQLSVFRRSLKSPRVSDFDRGFWVLLSRIWRDWRRSLVLVKPETVIRWQRSRVQTLLDMEEPEASTRSTRRRSRATRPDPEDEHGQSPLGSSSCLGIGTSARTRESADGL